MLYLRFLQNCHTTVPKERVPAASMATIRAALFPFLTGTAGEGTVVVMSATVVPEVSGFVSVTAGTVVSTVSDATGSEVAGTVVIGIVVSGIVEEGVD